MIGNVGSGPHAIGEDDLQAYVDGLLDVRRRSEVEAYLAVHPDEAERVEAYRAQNIALHALFDRYPAEEPAAAPVDRLRHQLYATVTRQRLLRRMAGAAAAACVAVVVGVAGWSSGVPLNGVAPGDRAGPAPEAVAVAPEPIRADDPYAHDPPRATSGVVQAGLVGWLSQRVAGGSPEWPDLQPFGLALTGERMASTAGGLAVELLYRGTKGRRVALHIDLKGDDAPMATPMVGDTEVAIFWRSGPLVLGLIGEMGRDEMLQIAEAVSDQVALMGSDPPAAPTGGGHLLRLEALPTAETVTSVGGDGASSQAAAQQDAGADFVVPDGPSPAGTGEAAGSADDRAPAAGDAPANDDGAGLGEPERQQPFSDLTAPRPIRAVIDHRPPPAPHVGSGTLSAA